MFHPSLKNLICFSINKIRENMNEYKKLQSEIKCPCNEYKRFVPYGA